jgi:hypothetical protein
MTVDERLARIQAKIERAKQHIRDAQTAVQSFFDATPYAVGTKRNPQTRQLIYYLVSVAELPNSIAAITGDVLQNLRSALDHLAYQLVSVGTGGKGPFDHVYFPISDDATKYEAGKHGRMKGMRQEAIKAIDAIKPYKGGDDMLWRLHKLNNIDKHRLLITVGSAYQSVDLGAHMHQTMLRALPDLGNIPALPLFVRPADRLFPLTAGDELFIDGADAEVNDKMQFRFDVAFGEPQVCEGDPLIETLQHMADLVDRLIPQFRPLLV